MSTTTLEIYQGRDQSFVLAIARADLEFEDGDITGLAFALKLHGGQTDAEAVLRKTLDAGLTLEPESDPETIRFKLDLTVADTAALSTLVAYVWDVVVLTGSTLSPVEGLSGTATVIARVNHSAA